MKRMIALLVGLLLGSDDAVAQGAVEQPSQPTRSGFPVVWPKGPGRDSVPDWAAPGKVRFARWDGGRIEVAKAVLSGWPGFSPADRLRRHRA